MYRRTTVCCLCLVLIALAGERARGAEGEPGAESESLWVTSIAQLGKTDQFVAATADGLLLREATVYSFAADDPTALTKLYTHPAAVWCVASTSGGERVASVDYRGNLVVFDTESRQPQLHEKALERWCQSMILAPDDRSIIAGNEAGKILAWDLSEQRVSGSVELDGHAVTGLAISPDGNQLAASDGGGHIHLLKWPSLEAIGKIDISEDSAWCVAYDGDGQLLVGSGDRKLYRCEAKPDAKPEVVAKGTDWITQLAVSPSAQIAAAEVGGRLHFPTTGGTDSMYAKSGVWALCWHGEEQLFAGTRKDGIVVAGRSWKWSEPKPATPQEPATETPTEDAPIAEVKEESATEPAAAGDAPADAAQETSADDSPAEKSENSE